MKNNNHIISSAIHDDIAAAEFIEDARRHCKLALEHGRTTTSPDRRRAICKEIESLRMARNAILEQFTKCESV